MYAFAFVRVLFSHIFSEHAKRRAALPDASEAPAQVSKGERLDESRREVEERARALRRSSAALRCRLFMFFIRNRAASTPTHVTCVIMLKGHM